MTIDERLIIRRCCVCKHTETSPIYAQVFFSDGYLSLECFKSFHKDIPDEGINELLKTSNGKKLYLSCNELPGPFYEKNESLSK